MLYVLYVLATIGIIFLLNKITRFIHNFKEHYEYLKELKSKHWERIDELSKIEWAGKHLQGDFNIHLKEYHSVKSEEKKK